MKIAVVGLGKIGLPLAVQYASKGHAVVGIDVNSEVVRSVNEGHCFLHDEERVPELLATVVKSKHLKATSDYTIVSESDVIVVIVPVITTEDYGIKYDYMDSAIGSIAAHLNKKQKTLVIFETTLPVGDTRNRMIPKIEESSGLKAGKDFFVAYSPERVYSGRILADLKSYPKIVGALDAESLQRAKEFYSSVLDAEIMPVKNLETAEAVKLFEMTYRNVNIALANEFAQFADASGINVMEAIKGANTISRFYHIHAPSRGVGGHCAPVYPHFLMNAAKKKGVAMRLVKTATEINDAMPSTTIKLLSKEMGSLSGKKILILGMSYRGNVKEVFKSPSLDLVKECLRMGAKVSVHDPLFSPEEIRKFQAEPANTPYEKCDAIILSSLHKEYEILDFENVARQGTKYFIDGINAFSRERIEAAGIKYKGIGC